MTYEKGIVKTNMFSQYFSPQFFGDYVFLTHGCGMEINGYNESGEKVITLKHDYKPLRVTDRYIQATHDQLQHRRP